MSKLLRYELRKTPFVFLLLSILIILIFKGAVAVTYCNNYNKEWRQIYTKYLTYAKDYDVKEVEKNLTIIREDFNEQSAEAEVIDTLLNQLKAREYCDIVKKTAQKESGYAFNMPSDFNKLRTLYASYDLPGIVNILGYRLFVEMNEVNLIPIIIILAFSSIFSIENETGMYFIIRTTGVGWNKIFKNKLAIAIGSSTGIFSFFYILDLLILLALSGFKSMNSSYRSVISSVLTKDSIGIFIAKYYIIGILNTVFITCLILLVSSLSKNSRLAYGINALTFVAFTIIGVTISEFDKVSIFVTGSFMNLFNETSLFVINNSLIIEQYSIILFTYIITIPFLIYALQKITLNTIDKERSV